MNTHVQIRDLSAPTLRKLKQRAAKEGISLSAYLRAELEKLAERPTMKELMERIRSRPPINISNEEIVKIIHEGREARDRQIDDAIGLTRR
jgi:antitoxin FitA